jgi:hypothetical protein
MSKFRKVAATPTKFPADLSEFTKLLTGGGGDDLTDLLNKENIKQNLVFLASLFPGWTDRYSPSAFYHALETDNPRGYLGTKHSQGAYEQISPALLKKIEEFKKNPPKDLKDLLTDKPISNLQNINVPESSDRYKSMREKLYPSSTTSTTTSTATSPTSGTTSSASSNQRFVKTSQRVKAEELKNAMPKWTIEDVLRDMAKFAARKDLSPNEKQQGMVSILSQYEKSIAPLSNFLDKNDIQYK